MIKADSGGYDDHGDPARDFDEIPEWKGGTPPTGSLLERTWTRPRQTFREMLKSRPTHLVLPLAASWGAYRLLSMAITRGAGDWASVPTILAVAAIGGGAMGIASVWAFGWILAATGRLLGGRGEARAVRAALAWGQAPTLLLLTLVGIQFAVLGPELFRKKRPGMAGDADLALFYTATLLARTFLNGSIIARVPMLLAEAHRFSIWRAIGAMLLGVVPALALIFATVVLVSLFS